MGYCLWEPKRVKNVEQDCQRLRKTHGKVCPAKTMKYKSKRRHVICDYAHRLPKLHCPWDEEVKKKCNEISPGKLYHGLHSTDVTERLTCKPPSHAAHPSLAEAPIEYHGRQAQDVTEMHTFASRGKRPPSRDYYYGREATDISEFLRIIPPVAKEGDERNEFFGRPKSDITNYNLFPIRLVDTNSRTEAACPLGRCPPGPMCDYVPLFRDKEGKLLCPQPVKPPSPVCESGTHELPISTTLYKRHQQESAQHFAPGAGGILAQIVPGLSRSEAKRPVGRGVPGVMADYVQLVRDESGKVLNAPSPQHWQLRQSCSHQDKLSNTIASRDHEDYQKECQEETQVHANRYDKKRPLGKVPMGVMHDFVPNPTKGKHKHTTNGYWALPLEYPPSPHDSCIEKCPTSKANQHEDSANPHEAPTSSHVLALTSTPNSTDINSKVTKDQRRNAICEIHDPKCPLTAEQGHVGSCISHPCVSNYVKWAKDGDMELGPCKKYGGRTRISPVRGSPCLFAATTSAVGGSSTNNVDDVNGSLKPCNSSSSPLVVGSSTSVSRSHSPHGYSHTDSIANQSPMLSPMEPNTTCPRVACQCNRIANKGMRSPSYGYVESISRLDPKYQKEKLGSLGSTHGSISSSVRSRPGSSLKASPTLASKAKSKKPKKKSMVFVTEKTSPQHFQVPYFGLAQTYVTNPAISPNLTPPFQHDQSVLPHHGIGGKESILDATLSNCNQRGHKGTIIRGDSREGMLKGVRNEEAKSCNQADICKHHHDGKSSWFGRSKTFVTDPTVSPNLTPPCFNTFQ